MKQILGFLSLVVIVSFAGACSTEKAANNNTAPVNGVVQTNANINQNLNANTAPSNVGVVTNNNGNKNTSGVNTINGNAKTNHNGKSKPANGNN